MEGYLNSGMYETLLKRWKTGTLHYVLKAVVAHIDAQEQEALGPGFVLKASRARGRKEMLSSSRGNRTSQPWC